VASYRVQIKPSAAEEIEAISRKSDRRRLVQRIALLAEDPRPPGSQKLSGHARYRLRQGPYRIVYSVADDVLIVYVVKVAHRKDVYRGTL
jgi:mRNA interferase RelE/StbE